MRICRRRRSTTHAGPIRGAPSRRAGGATRRRRRRPISPCSIVCSPTCATCRAPTRRFSGAGCESRQTLVPSAWSSEGEARPAHFDVRAWGPLLRWAAEERMVQIAGEADAPPTLAAAPVLGDESIYGVLSVSARERTGVRPRRRAGRGCRASRCRWRVSSSCSTFAATTGDRCGRAARCSTPCSDCTGIAASRRCREALCETARDVTSAPVAGLVRWNAAEQHGVVQAISHAGGDRSRVSRDRRIARGARLHRPAADRARGRARRHGGNVSIRRPGAPDRLRRHRAGPGHRSRDWRARRRREGHWRRGLARGAQRGPVGGRRPRSARDRVGDRGGEPARAHRPAHRPREPPAFRRAAPSRRGGDRSVRRDVLADPGRPRPLQGRQRQATATTRATPCFVTSPSVLGDAVRTVDLCARYGGEEIAILLPQTSQAGAIGARRATAGRRWSGGRRGTTGSRFG